MPSKRKKDKRQRTLQNKRPPQQQIDDQQRSVLGKLILWGAICALPLATVGMLLWWPFYRPSLEIDAASLSLNTFQPIPASFSVKNMGVLDAYSVWYWCFVSDFRVSGVEIHDYDHGPVHLTDTLSSNAPIDFICPGARIVSGDPKMLADIEIVLRYRSEYSPLKSFTCERYVTRKDANGGLKWFRQPVRACADLWRCLEPRHLATVEQGYQRCTDLPLMK